MEQEKQAGLDEAMDRTKILRIQSITHVDERFGIATDARVDTHSRSHSS